MQTLCVPPNVPNSLKHAATTPNRFGASRYLPHCFVLSHGVVADTLPLLRPGYSWMLYRAFLFRRW
jgi:hypothetical protein